MKEKISDEYLTTKELANYFKLSETTLNNWRASSPPKGPQFKLFGRAVRYKKTDIIEYERRHSRGSNNN